MSEHRLLFIISYLLILHQVSPVFHELSHNAIPTHKPFQTFSTPYKEQCISFCQSVHRCLSFTVKQITSPKSQFECQFYNTRIRLTDLTTSPGTQFYIDVRDCQDWFDVGATSSGIYEINWLGHYPRRIRCHMEEGDGGWLVFQRRFYPFKLKFLQNWQLFKDSFGDLTKEFWLGNDLIHEKTASENHDILIRAKLTTRQIILSRYNRFTVANESQSYQMHFGVLVNGIHSLANLTMLRRNLNGSRFHTPDQDNDKGCAERHGSFWHNACADIHPNKYWKPRWNEFRLEHPTGVLDEIELLIKPSHTP